MFDEFPTDDAKNVDRDNGLRSPTGIAAVNHDIFALGDDQTHLIFEVGRQSSNDIRNCGAAVGDGRIVLLVTRDEKPSGDGRISFDEAPVMASKARALFADVIDSLIFSPFLWNLWHSSSGNSAVMVALPALFALRGYNGHCR